MGPVRRPGRSLIREQGDIYPGKSRPPRRGDPSSSKLYSGGRLAEAEERVRELLNFQIKVVGERHPEYATGLCMLAEILSARDELTDAETLLQRALEIRKKSVGERHPDYASGLDQLGRLLLRWEDLTGAEPLLLKALEIRQATLGRGHPDYADSLAARLAEVYLRRDQTRRGAEHSSARARRSTAHAGTEDTQESAAALHRLSDVLVRRATRSRPSPSSARRSRSTGCRAARRTPNHYGRGTWRLLASLLQKKGDLNAAESRSWRLLLDA